MTDETGESCDCTPRLRSLEAQIRFLTLHLRNVEMRMPPAVPLVEERTLEILRLLRPHEVDGLRLVRRGSRYDGGYVLPDWRFRHVLSFGIGDNADIEVEFAQLGASVQAFDHTIAHFPRDAAPVSWHQVGLASESSGNWISLPDALKSYGGTDQLILMDVEGAEWSALDAMTHESLDLIDCLVIELHHLDRLAFEDHWLRVQSSLTLLLGSFVVVHVHGNNDCPTFRVATVDVPSTMECTFIHKRHATAVASARGPWPTGLDAPNNSHFTDIDLGPIWRLAVDTEY